MSIAKTGRWAIAATVVVAGMTARAEAAPLIFFEPTPAIVGVGDEFTVLVNVAPGGELIGGFGPIHVDLTGTHINDNDGSTTFTLFRLRFAAAQLGQTDLDLTIHGLSDGSGDSLLAGLQVTQGVTCVAQSPTSFPPEQCERQEVPEPAMLSVFGTGLAALAMWRRRTRALTPPTPTRQVLNSRSH